MSESSVSGGASSSSDVDRELVILRTSLERFKLEREVALLDISRSMTKSIATSKPGQPGIHSVTFSAGGSKGASRGGEISRVLETDVILVAFTDLNGGREKWPSALVANFPRGVAELGFMESNGSLWRLVKRDLAQDGMLKVVLQTAEIGEKELYLSADLDLVKDIQQAAVWFLRVIPPTAPVGTLQHQAAAVSSQGLLVQLELLAGAASASAAVAATTTDGANAVENGIGEPRLLVTASAESGEGGVALLTEKQRLADKSFRWCLLWEVVREDTYVDGLDDLANELELTL